MLIEACLNGDRGAYGTLVDSYQRTLYNLALRITGSPDDAMDVTQAAFVKAYERLHTFDPAHRFFSWIYRITVNEALNLVRDRRRESEMAVDPPSSADGPEVVAERREAQLGLERALDELSPHYRTVVVLKHLQGLSYREIAELIGVPEKTVKSRLFTARSRLRSILMERGVAR
jgi:RNA polymerase sigma-70 factor (ECF subfamily)